MNRNNTQFLQTEIIETDEINDIHSVLDDYEGVLKIRRDLGMTNEVKIYIQGEEHKVLKSDEMNYYVIADAGNYEISLIGSFGSVTRIVQVRALKMTELILKHKRGIGIPNLLYAIAWNITLTYPFIALVVRRQSFLFRTDLFITCLLLVAICYYLKKRYGRYYVDVVEAMAKVDVVNKAGYLGIDSIEANKDFVALSESECGIIEFNQPKQLFAKRENSDILIKRRGKRYKQYDQKYSNGTGWSKILLTTMSKDATEGVAFYFQTGKYIISLAGKEVELFVKPTYFYEVELKMTKIYRILNFIFKTSIIACFLYLFIVFVYHYPIQFEWGTFSIFVAVVIGLFIIREFGEKYKLSVHEHSSATRSLDYVFGLSNSEGDEFDEEVEEEEMQCGEIYDDEEKMNAIVNNSVEEEYVEALPAAGVLKIYRPFSFLDQETMGVSIQGEGSGKREYRKEYRYILTEGTYDVILDLDGVMSKNVQINNLETTEITVTLNGFGKLLQFVMKTSIWLFVLSLILLIISFFFPLPFPTIPQISGVLLLIFFISFQIRKKVNHYQVDVVERSVHQSDYEQAEVLQCKPNAKQLKVEYSPVLYENTLWNLYKKQVQLLNPSSFWQVTNMLIVVLLIIIALGIGTYLFQEKMMIVNLLFGILLLTSYQYSGKLFWQILFGSVLFVLTLFPGALSLVSVVGMALYLFPCIIALRNNFILSKIKNGQEVSEKTENKYVNIIKSDRDMKHKNYSEMYIDNQCISRVSKKYNSKFYFDNLVDIIEIENACLLCFAKGYCFDDDSRAPGWIVTAPYILLNKQDVFSNANVAMNDIVVYIKQRLEENKGLLSEEAAE